MAVPANRVQAKDTTGAGDLFTSGFLSAFLAGEPLDVCARTGCFMGAQVVQVRAPNRRRTTVCQAMEGCKRRWRRPWS